MSTEVHSSSTSPGISSNPETLAEPDALREIVQRAQSLYSLPVVAAEVIELTSNPKVDVRALKDCIEVDPALTAKILRVVNSSLFGLSREVGDLNQAIALLGTKPLKLLVLGFSLPAELFSKVAREQLEWYWATTLSRAVAAREISEQLWNRSGDDAFLAGLLQDIGVLVFLAELQQPYAQFLGRAIDENLNLQQVEVESLGFGHTALSVALLDHWKMPKILVEAIAERHDHRLLKKNKSPAGELAKILHLAGLLTELVARRRLDVLPELLEVGEIYCDLDKAHLNKLVASLQPKVEQLAEVLSLELCESEDYLSILTQAHEQMAVLAESVAEPLSRLRPVDRQTPEGVLEDATRLREAVHAFLHTATDAADATGYENSSPTTIESSSANVEEGMTTGRTPMVRRWLENKLILAVGQCRSMRRPLSVVLIEVQAKTRPSTEETQLISRALDAACRNVDCDGIVVEALAPSRRALILPDCERREAVYHSQSAIDEIDAVLARLDTKLEWTIDAGVATVALPSKNFSPPSLLETAERCLAAALSGDISVVKSLEIY